MDGRLQSWEEKCRELRPSLLADPGQCRPVAKLRWRSHLDGRDGNPDAGGAKPFTAIQTVGLDQDQENLFADDLCLSRGLFGISPRSSSRIANSSAPKRATVQDSPRLAVTRRLLGSKSPVEWPSVSLSVLKLSRSMSNRGLQAAFGVLEASVSRSRSRNRGRLVNPLNVS